MAVSEERGWSRLRALGGERRKHPSGSATLICGDAFSWIAGVPPHSLHAIVTDPPYGLIEYGARDHRKLRAGRGGVWRIPPRLDGVQRAPLPRFTVLSADELAALSAFFTALGQAL